VIILGCATLIGAVAALLPLWPSVSVQPRSPLRDFLPEEPIVQLPSSTPSVSFIVRNTSLYPLHDVQAECLATNFKFEGGYEFQLRDESGRIPFDLANMGQSKAFACVAAGQEFAFNCTVPRVGSRRPLGMEVQVEVSYRILWSWSKRFRFVTERQKSGELQWIPEP